MECAELEKDLNIIFHEEDIFVDDLSIEKKDGRECPVVAYEEDKPFDCYEIHYHISWGDWKHEHLVSKQLVSGFCFSLGMDVLYMNCTVDEEDGSDCYSAYHTIYAGILK